MPTRVTPRVAASTLQLPPGSWDTVLDCLCAHFTAIGREQWTSRMRRGLVTDEQGVPIDAARPYRVGLMVRYFREVAEEAPIPLLESIVHADAHLVVADKPHFLPVTAGGRFVEETLLTRLIRRLDNPALVPLHRIDRATAGLVMFSATPASRAAYQSLFPARRIDKRYEAVAPALSGLELPLTRRSRIVAGEPFFRMREVEGVANSETRVDVLERGAGDWRYTLAPVTGRTHQLRVHMAALGAPIRNDRYYPDLADEAPDDYNRPLQLLARALAFDDPLTGEPRRFESRLELLPP